MQGPSTTGSQRTEVAQGAKFAVVLLTGMNLLNYLDRQLPAPLEEAFKADLHLTDREASMMVTAFLFVYMLASPIFGALEARASRRKLISFGVAFWSLATGGAALAKGFFTLLVARSLVGVGEAAYATFAPALLGDFYPERRRNRILTIFYIAIPLGAAIGYVLGGYVGKHAGWRPAFLICGLPGLLIATLALKIRDPRAAAGSTSTDLPVMKWPEALRLLSRNRTYLVAVAGYTAQTFAIGGMAFWLPGFLNREHQMDLATAGLVVGLPTFLGGLLGTSAGGFLGDAIRGRTRQPYFAISAIGLVPGTALTIAALLVKGPVLIGVCLGAAQFFLWFGNGPINTVILNSVPAPLVAKAFAFSILAIHALGDAVSPFVIASVSEAFGDLGTALFIVPPAIAVGCVIWCYGWRTLPEREPTPLAGGQA